YSHSDNEQPRGHHTRMADIRIPGARPNVGHVSSDCYHNRREDPADDRIVVLENDSLRSGFAVAHRPPSLSGKVNAGSYAQMSQHSYLYKTWGPVGKAGRIVAGPVTPIRI